jgi:hypothetical protein
MRLPLEKMRRALRSSSIQANFSEGFAGPRECRSG